MRWGSFMDRIIWIMCTTMTTLLWSATCLLYKSGIHKDKEEYTNLKYTVSVGMVFFVIALVYLLIRKEPYSIWVSAVRYWPVTVYGIIYAIANTASFNGYVYNEVTVEAPVEGISGGTSTVMLILVYLLLGRVDSVSELLTPLKAAGILVILTAVLSLAMIRNKAARDSGGGNSTKESWKWQGLGTLIFPVIYAFADGLETVVTGVCLDTTYGFAMPEGDSIIIVGMEYAIFAFGCWCYTYWKEKKAYNPFRRENTFRTLGALSENAGIVFYSYAMAIDSVSTDPLLAIYPVLVMIGGRVLMKERISTAQYICLFSIIAGSVMVIIGTI